ncbi:MAG TPA: DUF3303 family protein [Acidimicrobiales bacterium]|jgi:hypothetical protein|nr:DUF3303 family protein [Acidimicrobiales bacterium]
MAMTYVMLGKWKTGVTQEQADGALMRRAGWTYPAGAKSLGEYWPMSTDPAVIAIFEADDPSVLMEVIFTWGDVFDITMLPAVSAEQGLALGPDAMARARA